jgi:phosphatidylinositol kinase/protein kinase (PI-3  family)
VGDDLRKDILITQMISIVDKYWKDEGLQLFMTHYNILSTGTNTGLIQVVQNASTIFKIQMEHGGATAAFSTKYLLTWLSQNNPEKGKS